MSNLIKRLRKKIDKKAIHDFLFKPESECTYMEKLDREIIWCTIWERAMYVGIALAIGFSYISLIFGARAKMNEINNEYPGAHKFATEIVEHNSKEQ